MNQFEPNGKREVLLRPVSLIILGIVAFGLPMAARANVVVKANNATTLNLAASWVTNGSPAVPGSADIAQWDSTVSIPANCTNTLGASLSWNGLKIASPAAAVNLNDSTHTLALGAGGIDLSAATVNLNLPKNVAANGNQTWNVPGGLLLQVSPGGANGILTGSGTVTLDGGGTFYLNQGGSAGFADAGSFAGFTGCWVVQGGATLAAIRNGASAFGTGGTITLNGGRLATGENAFEYGSWTWTNQIILQSGSTSLIDNWNAPGSGRYLKLQGVISGDGSLVFTNTYPGSFNSSDLGFILTANNSLTGNITICPNTPVRVGGVPGANTSTDAGTGGSLGTAAVLNNGVLTFSGSGSVVVSNPIAGTGTLNIGGAVSGAGAQVLTLAGANTYTGPTLVGQGTLAIGAYGSIANSTNITLSSSATLDVSAVAGAWPLNSGQTLLNLGGNITGNVRAASGSLIVPGGTGLPGDLRISGDFSPAGGVLQLNITNSGNDTITVNGDLSPTGVTTLRFVPLASALNPGIYRIIPVAGTLGGSPANFAIAGLVSSDGSQGFAIAYDSTPGNHAVELIVSNISGPPPALTGLTPVSGAASGGTMVTLTGSNFAPGLTVLFGGVAAASVTFSNSALATVITPALPIGTLDVTVINPDGQSNVLANAFTVTFKPSAASVFAWYAGDTSLVVGSDNYSVTSWSNLGTAATNGTYTQAGRNLTSLTGAPQKLYLRTVGGSPAGAVAFSGSDGIWATKSNFGILTNNYTIIACALVSNAAPAGFLFDSTSFAPGLTRALVRSNFWNVSVDTSAGIVTAPVTTNVWQIHSFVIGMNSGSPAIQHYINGVLVGSVAISSPDYLSGLMIGANVSQGNGIQADVAEFLVFNTALDDATRTNTENYLSAKWAGVVADTNAPPPPAPYVYTPVFVSGATSGYGITNGVGYPEYRIPAMVTALDGTVIAVADGRQGNGDIPNPLDCVCRRSFDNGNTWQNLQVIADYGSNQDTNDVDTYPAYGITNPIPRKCAGDSALLLDRTNGRVWVLYDNGAPNGGGRVIKLEMRYSDDNGATWSPRIDVESSNPGLRPPRSSAPEFLTGPGNGIQLASGPNAGRLVFPVYIYGNPYYSSIIYSDDHGATWNLGGVAGTGGGEIQVVETPGGGLLASMRDNAFSWSGVRTFSRSPDGGLTWGALFTATTNPPTIRDPACQGSILRLTTTNDSDRSRIVFANCNSSSSRVAMTLRISCDEGATWPVSNLVYSGVSGYSALAKLANGQVGLLNEVNGFARIDFVARSVNVISGYADAYPPADASRFNLTCLPPAAGNPPVLTFTALANNAFTVQYRDSLADGAWQTLAKVPASSTDIVVQIPVTNTNASRYFRLVTPQLP